MAQPWKVKDLDPEKGVPSCLKKILRTRVKEVFSYRTSAVTYEDVEALHDMRVAVRRLNALLRIFRRYFKPKPLKKHCARLKSLRTALGEVRDGDIFIGSLVQYRTSVKEAARPALDMIIEQEEHARSVHRERLKKTLHGFDDKHCVEKFDAFAKASLKRAKKQRAAAGPEPTFRENARAVVPPLLDAFLSRGADVAAHPRMKEKLHAMRIDGKRVRYGMEIFADIFGSRYERCLNEIKAFLDVMGTIHDCDVHIPKLTLQMKELRFYNANRSVRTERIRTQGLAEFIRELHRRRSALFAAMGRTLRQWDRGKFTLIVLRSMTAQPT